MRRPRRELQIFTMSALDVLAMATGVFVLLLVMLMPYYRRSQDAAAELDAIRVAAEAAQAEVAVATEAAAGVEATLAAARAEAERLNGAAASIEATLRREPAPAPPPADGRVIEALDLIFVIDTTASMTPIIGDLAVSLRGIVRVLERLVPSVRIGVSAYKDHDTGLAPVITLPMTAADAHLDRIVRFLEEMQASTVGSRTIPEDVHLGLEAAMLFELRPQARQAMILIGDATVHEPLIEETVERVRRYVAGQKRRTVSSLFTSTPSSRANGEALPRQFFQAVARAGGGTYNDHTGGMTESILLAVLAEEPPAAP
jgi:hypothetical protein